MRERKRKRKNVLVLLAQYLGENAEEREESVKNKGEVGGIQLGRREQKQQIK